MAEIELKLQAPEERSDALRRAIAKLARKGAKTQELVATYFDTKNHTLHGRGLTLRIRRENGAFVQTVKSSKASLIKRGEWSDEVADLTPDLRTGSGKRVRRLVRRRLRPQFEVRVKRQVFEIKGEAEIEVALDQGTVSGERINEVELELKAGDTAALYDVALKLTKAVPLTIETRAKSTRGYDLITHRKPPEVKAQPVAVAPDMTVEDVLRDGARRLLAQYLRNTPAVLAENPEGVHQMRVALRRLRSLIKAVSPYLSEETAEWTGDRLKTLLRALGPAREWDVFMTEMVAPLTERKKAALEVTPAFRRATHLARLAAHRQARASILAPEHTVAVLELLRWFEGRGWGSAGNLGARVGKCAAKILDRQFRRAIKRSRHFATLPAEDRHKFRIALKELRYGLELFAPLLPGKKVRAYLRRIKPLQDALGHLNDIATARALMAAVVRQNAEPAIARDGGLVIGWYERIAAAGDRRLCRAVAAFRDANPPWR